MAEWTALGDRAVRFARPAGVPARSLVRAVRGWPGVVDVVVARDEVAAYFAGAPQLHADQIRALAIATDDPEPVRNVAIAVVYDGEDLEAVARACELSVEDVVRRHHQATYVVDAIGFAPGFAYLRGLDARLVLPRRATPRTRVPAGSLAIAGEHTAVYPFDSPGGWHVIGRVVDGPMFSASGARLRLGDHVVFVA
ncbi:MAG TPA: carboxyltransferase domain-containing protein [Kofleriaceae bacterium]|nr:carboxyltransferase domain-containing protein [Kofleriaceae bacterium]